MSNAAATEKQIAFATKLMGERPNWADHLNGNTYERAFDLLDGSKFASKTEMSQLIEALLAMPKPAPVATPGMGATEAGFYFDAATENVYRVRPAKSTGNLYAERLVVAASGEGKGTFEYVGGLVKRLDPAWLLSLEQAKAIGRQFGFCVRCGALLTDEKSVANGIGPVCGKTWAKQEAAIAG